MKQEINDFELDQVVGGTTYLSEARNKIAFGTLGEKYDLNCSFKEARDLCNKLFSENADMSEKQYDTLVRDEFYNRGWLNN